MEFLMMQIWYSMCVSFRIHIMSEELRPMSGNDSPVSEYVMKDQKHKFLEVKDMVTFLIPNYIIEERISLSLQVDVWGSTDLLHWQMNCISFDSRMTDMGKMNTGILKEIHRKSKINGKMSFQQKVKKKNCPRI